eukprot:gene18557-27267_t
MLNLVYAQILAQKAAEEKEDEARRPTPLTSLQIDAKHVVYPYNGKRSYTLEVKEGDTIESLLQDLAASLCSEGGVDVTSSLLELHARAGPIAHPRCALLSDAFSSMDDRKKLKVKLARPSIEDTASLGLVAPLAGYLKVFYPAIAEPKDEASPPEGGMMRINLVLPLGDQTVEFKSSATLMDLGETATQLGGVCEPVWYEWISS